MTDLAYTLASAAARGLPRRAGEALAAVLADLYTWTHPARVRAVDRRLRRIWATAESSTAPPAARETYRAFATAVLDFLLSRPGSKQHPLIRLDEEARRILREARESGRSTVLVSGHFGPWEVALQWVAGEVGGVDALARAHRFRAVERFFARRRAAFGVRTLSSGRPASAAIRRLRAGGWIAALVDRGLRVRDRSRGREGPTGPGLLRLDPAPLLLARRASAQVLAGVAWRARDGAVEVRFHPAFSLEPRCGGVDVPEALARLERFFEAHIRAHPTQWFHWTRPAAEMAGGLEGADRAGR